MIELAKQYGRYGYRMITALLRLEGWTVNHKRIERLWRREGLKVPKKQPKKKRIWLSDGSCIRLRPAYKNHVWSYDFIMTRTHDGRAVKILTIIDEHTRECLSFDVERGITKEQVLLRVVAFRCHRRLLGSLPGSGQHEQESKVNYKSIYQPISYTNGANNCRTVSLSPCFKLFYRRYPLPLVSF